MVLEAPPDCSYSSIELALVKIKRFTSDQGYAVVRRRSKKTKIGDIHKVWLQCDKSGLNIPRTAAITRNVGTRKTDCNFSMTITHVNSEWISQVLHPIHNHEASESLSTHPTNRKKSKDTRDTILQMQKAGCMPRQIEACLLQKDVCISKKDINNEIQSLRAKSYNGLPSVQKMLLTLYDYRGGSVAEERYFYKYQFDENMHVSHLFFAHSVSIQLLRKHFEVLLLDCTYKTNRYRMPLLHAVAVDNFGGSFSVAFCFLRAETERDYIWAISALKSLYDRENIRPKVIITDKELALRNACRQYWRIVPQLLCKWHLIQNLKSFTKKAFSDNTEDERARFLSDCKALLEINTQDQYDTQYRAFRRRYAHKSALLEYINGAIHSCRIELVNAFSSSVLHFGHHVTSRIEGSHAVLKAFLRHSSGDLNTVLEQVDLMMNSTQNRYTVALGQAKDRRSHTIQLQPLFSEELKQLVTPVALGMINKQIQRLKERLPECTRMY